MQNIGDSYGLILKTFLNQMCWRNKEKQRLSMPHTVAKDEHASFRECMVSLTRLKKNFYQRWHSCFPKLAVLYFSVESVYNKLTRIRLAEQILLRQILAICQIHLAVTLSGQWRECFRCHVPFYQKNYLEYYHLFGDILSEELSSVFIIFFRDLKNMS